jgi:hypothetical protein
MSVPVIGSGFLLISDNCDYIKVEVICQEKAQAAVV